MLARSVRYTRASCRVRSNAASPSTVRSPASSAVRNRSNAIATRDSSSSERLISISAWFKITERAPSEHVQRLEAYGCSERKLVEARSQLAAIDGVHRAITRRRITRQTQDLAFATVVQGLEKRVLIRKRHIESRQTYGRARSDADAITEVEVCIEVFRVLAVRFE